MKVVGHEAIRAESDKRLVVFKLLDKAFKREPVVILEYDTVLLVAQIQKSHESILVLIVQENASFVVSAVIEVIKFTFGKWHFS